MNILDICNKTRGYVKTLQIAFFFSFNIPLISPLFFNEYKIVSLYMKQHTRRENRTINYIF